MYYLNGSTGHIYLLETAIFEQWEFLDRTLPIPQYEVTIWRWRRKQLRDIHATLLELAIQIEVEGYYMDTPERSPLARSRQSRECRICHGPRQIISEVRNSKFASSVPSPIPCATFQDT